MRTKTFGDVAVSAKISWDVAIVSRPISVTDAKNASASQTSWMIESVILVTQPFALPADPGISRTTRTLFAARNVLQMIPRCNSDGSIETNINLGVKYVLIKKTTIHSLVRHGTKFFRERTSFKLTQRRHGKSL
jgi:hypothetical protein